MGIKSALGHTFNKYTFSVEGGEDSGKDDTSEKDLEEEEEVEERKFRLSSDL